MRGGNERGIPGTLLSRLSQSLEATVGLHFPRERWRQLADGIGAAAGALGFEDAESCVRHLISAPLTREQIEILAPHVTVGETYFFREPACFAALEQDVLPGLIRSRRGGEQSLRIWSAGCASGEEPYSIAILLEQLIPDMADWRITILATDINPASLQRADAGRYAEWSYRGAPRWLKERYFQQTAGGRFEIDPHIRRMVTFSYLNLEEDSYPSALASTDAIDLIFCRNVLMYFAPHRARKVVQRLHRALAEGGWLVLGAAEASSELCSQFSAVAFSGATLYRKERSSGAPLFGHDHPGEVFGTPGDTPVVVGDMPEGMSPTATSARRCALDPLFPPLPLGEGQGDGPGDAPGPAMGLHPLDPCFSPTAPDASYESVLTIYEAGRYAEVVAKLADRLPGQPEPSDEERLNGKTVALLARAHANQGQLAEALRCCEIGVALDKLNPASHYLLATILQEMGREAEAALTLRRALYLDQDFVPARFALGNLARQRGSLREATRHFQVAQALLERCAPEEILPESEGMTAGSLKAIIRSLLEMETSV